MTTMDRSSRCGLLLIWSNCHRGDPTGSHALGDRVGHAGPYAPFAVTAARVGLRVIAGPRVIHVRRKPPCLSGLLDEIGTTKHPTLIRIKGLSCR